MAMDSVHRPGATFSVGFGPMTVCSVSIFISVILLVHKSISKSACKCVAKMPRHSDSSSFSRIAPASAAPAHISVPFPSSSIRTREFSVTSSRTVRISCISTANPLLPSRGLSELKFRSMIWSTKGIDADSAGTRKPHVARTTSAPTLRRTVDLPAMLGPERRTRQPRSRSFFTVLCSQVSSQKGQNFFSLMLEVRSSEGSLQPRSMPA
mmetsp:Transcript_9752/g.29639  ORF Transcript_9752/g.29639 Transcript_9752/m.29639 type:complete len:209 (-) Transcript_9752:1822-2448(-)